MKHYAEVLLLTIVAVFAPLKEALIVTLVLIIIDFISGILASKKTKEPLTSAGFRRSISKIVIYEIALVIGFLAETYMLNIFPITKMISSLVALTELKSIYENLDIINGGGLLKSIISQLGSANEVKPVDKE